MCVSVWRHCALQAHTYCVVNIVQNTHCYDVDIHLHTDVSRSTRNGMRWDERWSKRNFDEKKKRSQEKCVREFFLISYYYFVQFGLPLYAHSSHTLFFWFSCNDCIRMKLCVIYTHQSRAFYLLSFSPYAKCSMNKPYGDFTVAAAAHFRFRRCLNPMKRRMTPRPAHGSHVSIEPGRKTAPSSIAIHNRDYAIRTRSVSCAMTISYDRCSCLHK